LLAHSRSALQVAPLTTSLGSVSAGSAVSNVSAIDTPEYDQPYGAQSSAALKAMLPLDSTVELGVVTQDQFHRMVAVVWRVENDKRTNINEAMLRGGHAWPTGATCRVPRSATSSRSAREEGGPLGPAGERLGISTRMALPQEWRDSRGANALRRNAREVLGDLPASRQRDLRLRAAEIADVNGDIPIFQIDSGEPDEALAPSRNK
jgi:hypothetical protein